MKCRGEGIIECNGRYVDTLKADNSESEKEDSMVINEIVGRSDDNGDWFRNRTDSEPCTVARQG